MTTYATQPRRATPMNQANKMRSSNPHSAGLATYGLGFSHPVPAGGYRWWYVDGFSDCGQFGITLIAFIGSVFSPYYFRSRSKGAMLAEDHVSLNAILYGPSKSRWCMTERGSTALSQSSAYLAIGPSAMRLADSGITIEIDERATPFGQRVRGAVHVQFENRGDTCFELDNAGEHWWWPIAPLARMQVAMERPALEWTGSAYMDSNYGARPIETGFSSWNWCRGHSAAQGCQIHYDAQLAAGGSKQLSLSVDDGGVMRRQDFPALQNLSRSPVWRVARPARLPASRDICVKTLEDTPFYTRSQVRADGHEFMHESLDLSRFRQPWVQFLLPFRMPRVA